eukprot:8394044-Karenia_brevis.AAC.1
MAPESPREPQRGLLEPFPGPGHKMAPESPREVVSWSHFRAQARKWPQRAPERPPGAISGPRPENGPR